MEIKKIFASNLEKLRIGRSLDRKQLADLVGVDHVAIWRWENGVGLPTSKTMDRIAEALGVDASSFFNSPSYSIDESLGLLVESIKRNGITIEENKYSLTSIPENILKKLQKIDRYNRDWPLVELIIDQIIAREKREKEERKEKEKISA